MGFCQTCSAWRFENNISLQSPDEQEGFGVCERFEQMKANPQRALMRSNDEFAERKARLKSF